MTLKVSYFQNLLPTDTISNVATSVRVPGLSVTANAEEGSVAISTIAVDDPNGTLDFVGMRRVFITEDSESPLNTAVWTGFLGDATISRGPGAGLDNDVHVIGAARRWTLNLVDVNSLISRKVIRSGGDRPAETDIARVNWLIDTWQLPINNTAGYIATSGGVSMDATDYTNQTAFDVLNDAAQASGRNWFAFYDQATDTNPPVYIGSYSLFYNSPGSSIYDSGIRLTNVQADVDDTTTFVVLNDATINRDPSRLADGILVTYNGGSVYVQNNTTGDTYFGPGYSRDLVMPHANTSSEASASALARRYVSDASSPVDRISCSFLVPKEKVNALYQGQRVQIKFTHFFTEYAQSYVYARCLKRTVTQLSDDQYRIDVELAPSTDGGVGGAACEPVQYAYTESTFDTPYDVVLGSAPTAGNTLAAIFWRRAAVPGENWTPTSISGGSWTERVAGNGYDVTQYGGPGAEARLVVYTHLVGASESATITVTPDVGWSSCMVIEIPGTYASVTDSGNVTLTAGQELSVSRTSGGSALLLAIWSMQRTVYAPQDSITTSTSTEIRDRWAMEGSIYRAPHTWVAWTNTDAAATLTITGSPDANPNLNKWGTFAAGLLFDCN